MTDLTTTIEFSNDDLKDQKPTFAKLKGDTYYQFEVQTVKQYVFPNNGNIALNMRVAPVKEDGSTGQPHGFIKVNVPVRNPEVAGHTAPANWVMTGFLRAIADENLPGTPRKQDDGSYLSEDGEVFSKQEASSLFEARDLYVGRTGVGLLNQVINGEDSSLIGEKFFGRTDNSDWRNIKQLTAEEPEDEAVERENFSG